MLLSVMKENILGFKISVWTEVLDENKSVNRSFVFVGKRKTEQMSFLCAYQEKKTEQMYAKKTVDADKRKTRTQIMDFFMSYKLQSLINRDHVLQL